MWTVPGHPSHSCYISITGRRNEIMFPALAVEIVTLCKILHGKKTVDGQRLLDCSCSS